MAPATLPKRAGLLPWQRDLLTLWFGALLVLVLAAGFITHPGYVDAYYYFGGALQLARGAGFTEPYLWNYLAAGQPGVGMTPPWPSHLYWMPLASILAAPFMALAERLAGTALPNAILFRMAQVPFMALAATLPLLTYGVAWRLSRLRRHAVAAALLTLIAPFYFAYWFSTDAFAVYALAAGMALWAAAAAGETGELKRACGWALGAGLGAGLAHLARADGVLVLLVAGAWLAWERRRTGWRSVATVLSVLGAGYLLVMAPWFWRNWLQVGQPLPAGGTQTLWLRHYDEVFNYPANLTPADYFGSGWKLILASKWTALQSNAASLAVVQGGVVAFPFVLAGLWRCRRVPLVALSVIYGLALFALMTLAFSFPGARGGYFHSGAALLPVFGAAALVGLDAVVEAAARRLPHWQPDKSKPVFTMLLVASTLGLTAVVFGLRVIGPDPQRPAWMQQDVVVYSEANTWLTAHDTGVGLAVVNNPPGWTYWTGRPAIVVPNGDVAVLLRAMDDYDARWLVLDQNFPAGLAELYAAPESEPRLRLRVRLGAANEPAVYLLERVAAP